MFNQLHKNITAPGAEIPPYGYDLKAQHRAGLLIMEKLEKKEITQGFVKECFDYREGYLYWKVRASQQIQVGDLAGSLRKTNNRREIMMNKKTYYSARLIFLWHKGWLPEMVDHKDRNSLNENIDNLRAATRTQNATNVSSRKNSTSKYLGVSYNTNRKKWISQIMVNKVKKYLGIYSDEEAAAIAYNKAAELYFGEFANLNIIK